MTMAIGFCEESGLLVAMLRRSLKNVPPGVVPYLIAFLGTCGNIASDTAMIVIPPLAAIVYIGVKKHPVVGMMVGYAGAQAGFTANLMVAGTDSLLQGLTNQAIDAFLGAPGLFAVDVTCNWYPPSSAVPSSAGFPSTSSNPGSRNMKDPKKNP